MLAFSEHRLREQAERELRRRELIEARRTVWECYREAGDDAELKRICRERDLTLWEDAKKDADLIKKACHELTIELTEDLEDEQWKQACRERDIELLEDHDHLLHPHDPIMCAAVEIAFNPMIGDVVRNLGQLREELRRRQIYSRAHLDAVLI